MHDTRVGKAKNVSEENTRLRLMLATLVKVWDWRNLGGKGPDWYLGTSREIVTKGDSIR